PTPRGWQTDTSTGNGLAVVELDAELTENTDGSVTVHGLLSGIGIADSTLADEITVTLIRDGNQFLVINNPAYNVIVSGGFPIHEFTINVPASQIPAGTNPVDFRVNTAVAGIIGFDGFTVHCSVD